MPAHAAAATPRMIVPRRVVSSLLDMMLSTFFLLVALARHDGDAVGRFTAARIAARAVGCAGGVGVVDPEPPYRGVLALLALAWKCDVVAALRLDSLVPPDDVERREPADRDPELRRAVGRGQVDRRGQYHRDLPRVDRAGTRPAVGNQ